MSSTTQPLRRELATTRNLPNAGNKTHIIALCGASDIRNSGDPSRDGWFVADFFLWKAVLRGMGLSQTWITCLDPRRLVNKYEHLYPTGPYAQGGPFEDNRAVVLSRTQLPEALTDLVMVKDQGDVLLRDTFLEIFRKLCERAARAGEEVLFLDTSHGDIDISDGVLIIGLPEPLKNAYPAELLLTSELLDKTIRHIEGLKLSTFPTSCLSENWVITPYWAPHRPVVTAAAEKDEESLAQSPWRSPTGYTENQLQVRTGSWSGATGIRLRSKVTELAQKYLASHPGLDNMMENRWAYSMSKDLIRGTLEDSELVNLENILSYRLYKTYSAERLLREMGNISMPPISKWVWEDWASQLSDPPKKATFLNNLEKIKKWRLCTPPVGVNYGREYLKPEKYLAAAFSMKGKNPDDAYAVYQEKALGAARRMATKRLKGRL